MLSEAFFSEPQVSSLALAVFGQQSACWFKIVERNCRKDVLQVDAFAHRPLFGNPASVVFDADDMSGETM
ncbi:hypothetical protein [Stappia sp. ICDLI1TA098]